MNVLPESIPYSMRPLEIDSIPGALKSNSILKLYIKYMVSIRCKLVVKSVMDKIGLNYGAIELGEVEFPENITKEQRNQLRAGLLKEGFELLDDETAALIQRTKNIIVEMVHYTNGWPRKDFSEYLSEKLTCENGYLIDLFAEVTGISLENYIIAHKVDRVKELLIYDELTLAQISEKLNYTHVGQLSRQFKKATGLTPAFFKQLRNKKPVLAS